MGKREQEELRRLEAALLESEYQDETPVDELDLLEDTWQEVTDVRYDMYNADYADVDLDDYSEDIHRGRRSNSVLPLVAMLAIAALIAMIAWLLKFLGVM